MVYYNYYYLLYKIKLSPIYWIVNESITEIELINSVKKFKSKTEDYIVVKKKYPDMILEDILDKPFKRFKKFEFDKNTRVIYQT